MRLFAALLAALLTGLPGPTVAQTMPTARSPRNASYTLSAQLDPATRLLQGSGSVHWTNLQEQATDELWFHLYWNAFRNDQSTWMQEDRRRDRQRDRRPQEGDWGSIELLRISADGVDLQPSLRYESPDDDNNEDRTVVVVTLPAPVESGAAIDVQIAWRSRVPRTFARTGFRGDDYLLAHWFPKLGIYRPDGWSCHQFHAGTEFASDFGVYDVSLTVPSGWIVGATGLEVEQRDNHDGTATHRFVEHDVHSFTWTTSANYRVQEARFNEQGLPPVDLRLLLQPEHLDQAERHFAATRAALRTYGTWYGPYPYSHLTIIDPAFGSGFGGMEYPTLFTAGTRLFNPPSGGSPEGVTIHEAGHQFWYGISANDEMEHAWLDEGLNTFTTARAYEETYGERLHVQRFFSPPGTKDGDFFALAYPEVRLSRAMFGNRLDRFRSVAGGEVQATPTYRYLPSSSPRFSYDLTALWLSTLERLLGWDVLRRGLGLFFARAAFHHPLPEDLFQSIEEAAGQDLDWFFDQVHRGSVTFDYAIDSVASVATAIRGLRDNASGELNLAEPADEEPQSYRTEVVVRRRGQGVFPVEVLLVFEDGHELRQQWAGDYPTTLITAVHGARLQHAVVDPERILLLDIDWRNNFLAREAGDVRPAVRWSLRWMTWLQDYLSTLAVFFG